MVTLLGEEKAQIQKTDASYASKVKAKFVQSKNSKNETALSQLIQQVMGCHLIYMEFQFLT